MKIGIDISQLAYTQTGVANYLYNLINTLLAVDTKNEYVLFYSSLRRSLPKTIFDKNTIQGRVTLKKFKLPPSLLDILWNRLHIIPIEWLIGPVDVFISSDWTQPPTIHAKKVTILYDLIVYTYPDETAEKIVQTQKRRLKFVQSECDHIFCISEATKNDAQRILSIPSDKLSVLYPGGHR